MQNVPFNLVTQCHVSGNAHCLTPVLCPIIQPQTDGGLPHETKHLASIFEYIHFFCGTHTGTKQRSLKIDVNELLFVVANCRACFSMEHKQQS